MKTYCGRCNAIMNRHTEKSNLIFAHYRCTKCPNAHKIFLGLKDNLGLKKGCVPLDIGYISKYEQK